MIRTLGGSFSARAGVPTIDRVDTTIFSARYFTACMSCTFCHDACCSFGVDLDATNVERLLARADELEPLVGVPRGGWFEEETSEDAEVPGGRLFRTRTRRGMCVFYDDQHRGCRIHRFCLDRGIDYHELKPMVSSLFPVTFGDGVLWAADEVVDGTLVCGNQGPTLYRGIRDELAHYFGEGLLAELDRIEAELGAAPVAR